jgi:hypothetical protein
MLITKHENGLRIVREHLKQAPEDEREILEPILNRDVVPQLKNPRRPINGSTDHYTWMTKSGITDKNTQNHIVSLTSMVYKAEREHAESGRHR